MYEEDIIEHSGVKGMKWGHRRMFNKLDKMTSGQGRYGRSDAKAAAQLKKLNERQKQINAKYGRTVSVSKTARGIRKTVANQQTGIRSGASLKANSKATAFAMSRGLKQKKLQERYEIAKAKGNTKQADKILAALKAHKAYDNVVRGRVNNVIAKTDKQVSSYVKGKKKLQKNGDSFRGLNDTITSKAINKINRQEMMKQVALAALRGR